MDVLKVNFSSSDAPDCFTRSLRETGFAVLTHHPIPQDLIFKTYDVWKKFFASEEKFKYKFDPVFQSGYFPFRSENAKDYSKKDLKEFYHVFSWGKIPDSVAEPTREIFDGLSDLAVKLLGWIEEYTPSEISSRFSMPLSEMITESRETKLRPIHYPPLTGDEEQGAIRAAAHEDINLITLLPAATAPGLQVKDNAEHWFEVPCDLGSIVVNSGDMLQMASQAYYRSTTHRVVNPTGPESKNSRYSMPLFLHPRWDVPLSPRMTAGQYLEQRLREIGLRL